MEQLVNFIIRPPRAEYDPKHDLLDQEFTMKGKWYQRKDLEVKNSRGDVLHCSHYMPIINPGEKALPCVIYCHGNSGCRADGSEAAIILLPSNITVFTLDFSGSGLSGGEHVTLGWNEKDDLRAVVDYLRADGNVSLIGLWGRSMGAVTSLMYGAEDPSIAGMVLDSPFSDLVDLMMELVDTYKVRLPKFTVKFAIQYMRKAIQKKAKFVITDLNAVKVAKSCFVPVLLGHAIDDDFIRPHHSDRIFEAYVGDKNIIKFEGDHNSPRPQFYFDSINIFFHNILQPPEDEVGGSLFETMDGYLGKGSWSTIREVGFDAGSSAAFRATPTSSTGTADAIKQVRSRRPMSRMEVPTDIPSKNDQSGAEDGETDDEHCPSSSNMISFELSNGDPFGPHVPTTMNDDQYVEYQLDDLTGFPCSEEEEKRMLMEAVLKSLKDLEMSHSQDQPAGVRTDSLESSGTNNFDTDSTPGIHGPLKTDSAPTSMDRFEPSNTETSSSSAIISGNLATQHPSPDTSVSSAGPIHDTPTSTVLTESMGSSSRSDTSASIQSSSDADVSGETKATVTVVRKPTNHIMDGFMRRWDLKFFRRRY